ncbi:unnamed protein product [Heligmosomoides polygyrus]|uniref:Histone-lysine N-methyltransferase SETMAR n=1 Tax=Heligmosomoides polygyrus TaxID=6339 RepID=A0A183G5I8_HELPZ|nr:unnamed protein product [Heligmosomoides polygyrus]
MMGKRRGGGMFTFFTTRLAPHSARLSRQKLQELRWEVLPHTSYSQDPAPSDFHLFRALKQHLRDRCFNDQTELESEMEHFFESQLTSLWKEGFRDLAVRWHKVVDVNGNYIVD